MGWASDRSILVIPWAALSQDFSTWRAITFQVCHNFWKGLWVIRGSKDEDVGDLCSATGGPDQTK